MAELLTSSLLWRVLLAIVGWFSALAHSSKVLTFLGRTGRSRRSSAWCIRRLASADAPTRESRAAKRFERLNARLAAQHGLKDCLDHSLLCRIWRFFVRCGQNSRLFSWLFSDGLHGVILFALSMYVVIDYVLRDLLAVPVLSSCWDECLMLLALVVYAVGWQQVIKHLPLTTAYANKAVTVVWGILLGLAVFGEAVTPRQVIGAVIIICGIVLFVRADNEGEGGQ